MQDLSPEDRYQLRKVQMDADKKMLELNRLILELEHKYGLLTTGQTVDPRTATIQGAFASNRSNGKKSEELLAVAAADETSR